MMEKTGRSCPVGSPWFSSMTMEKGRKIRRKISGRRSEGQLVDVIFAYVLVFLASFARISRPPSEEADKTNLLNTSITPEDSSEISCFPLFYYLLSLNSCLRDCMLAARPVY